MWISLTFLTVIFLAFVEPEVLHERNMKKKIPWGFIPLSQHSLRCDFRYWRLCQNLLTCTPAFPKIIPSGWILIKSILFSKRHLRLKSFTGNRKPSTFISKLYMHERLYTYSVYVNSLAGNSVHIKLFWMSHKADEVKSNSVSLYQVFGGWPGGEEARLGLQLVQETYYYSLDLWEMKEFVTKSAFNQLVLLLCPQTVCLYPSMWEP